MYIPIVEERLETKAKFSELEDRLLVMILSERTREISKIRSIYFPGRQEDQIRNRIKNLSANGKEIVNQVK